MARLSQHPSDLNTVLENSTNIVSHTTAQLSTIPYPIEPVEELVSVISVTSCLIINLQETIDRFPHLVLSSLHSFLNPFIQDILFASKQFEIRFGDATRSRIFHPSDENGHVRHPRIAWLIINGGDAQAAGLRSRLYVEKYRGRVLIDAVLWYGLRSLDNRTVEEEREFQCVRGRLPLVAERLDGVWRDYAPRLKALAASTGIEQAGNGAVSMQVQQQMAMNAENQANIVQQQAGIMNQQQAMARQQQAAMAQAQQQVMAAAQAQAQSQPPRYEQAQQENTIMPAPQTSAPASDEKHTTGSKSSTTEDKDTNYSCFTLHTTAATTRLESTTTTSVFLIPLKRSKTTVNVPESHNITPRTCSYTECRNYITTAQACRSWAEHMVDIHRVMLEFPESAREKIRELVESKNRACSGQKWELVALVQDPTTKANTEICVDGRERFWHWRRRRGGGSDVSATPEWVIVLKGKIVNLPESPVQVQGLQQQQQQGIVQAQIRQQQLRAQQAQQASATRQAESKPKMSIVEAEAKMDEMLKDLFKFEDEDEDESDGEEDESGGEDDKDVQNEEGDEEKAEENGERESTEVTKIDRK